MSFELMKIKIEEWKISELHDYISSSVEKKVPVDILNVNIHAMNLLHKDKDFFELMKSSDCVFCDGEGVRIAANFKGANIPYKITYADWMNQFLPYCEQKKHRLFFLGSDADTLKLSVNKVKQDYSKLNLVGSLDGFQSYEKIKKTLLEKKPEIIIVGMGMPLQEKVIRKLKLDHVCGVFLSGGAVFDYVSGSVKRAPKWMIILKLEWLFRLFQNPKRLFYRYIIGNPLFYLRVILNKAP
ncbi:MAG: hypothetical protein COB02_00495 [Candidatus Cloacimonadota bacterium]|nr:MAG: hypothetical protein COB02_00495 [Candidatus Cloacimonadota bacterium]